MSDIQRAIERQAKLEAEATEGTWVARARFGNGYVEFPNDRQAELYGGNGYEDATLIAHARNQLKLARDVILRALRILDCYRNPELEAALNAWADYVLKEET